MYYEWIEKSDPKMFAEIAKRIKEGRWCVAGGLVFTARLQYP